jgi:hypothetical protein
MSNDNNSIAERNVLAEAIAQAAQKAGIYNGEVPLTVPQLIMLCDDLVSSRVSTVDSDGDDDELRRWQDAIRDKVIEASGAPDHVIDGAGCDSGDPLDLTLTEIGLGFNFIDDQFYDAINKSRPGFQWPEGKSATQVAVELLSTVDSDSPLVRFVQKLAEQPHYSSCDSLLDPPESCDCIRGSAKRALRESKSRSGPRAPSVSSAQLDSFFESRIRNQAGSIIYQVFGAQNIRHKPERKIVQQLSKLQDLITNALLVAHRAATVDTRAVSTQPDDQNSSNTENGTVALSTAIPKDSSVNAEHAFEPNQQCSGLTCEICGNNKEWHVERDEVLRRRRAIMPDYDRKLKEWLS